MTSNHIDLGVSNNNMRRRRKKRKNKNNNKKSVRSSGRINTQNYTYYNECTIHRAHEPRKNLKKI